MDNQLWFVPTMDDYSLIKRNRHPYHHRCFPVSQFIIAFLGKNSYPHITIMEECEEVMKLQQVLSYVRKAADDYHMIEEGDYIAVGISGGKDSLTLL